MDISLRTATEIGLEDYNSLHNRGAGTDEDTGVLVKVLDQQMGGVGNGAAHCKRNSIQIIQQEKKT